MDVATYVLPPPVISTLPVCPRLSEIGRTGRDRSALDELNRRALGFVFGFVCLGLLEFRVSVSGIRGLFDAC